MSVPFTDIIRQARNGILADQLTDALAEVVKRVDEVEKPGALTITIKVKPDKMGGTQKTLEFGIAQKLPRPDAPEAIFYSTVDGDLLRNDPTQTDMFRDTSASAQRAS